MKVLVDTNVLIDEIMERMPFLHAAEKILDLCGEKKIEGYIAANSILNIFYILRKDFSQRKRRKLLLSFSDVLNIVAVDDIKLETALKYSAFLDFEDCIQYLCAKEVGADYIITRNLKDFVRSDIRVITPDEFLEKFD